ncbi:MAG: DUF4177 domain-containing protein [Methanobrevibacter sp.]|jgi:hypothetical protein|nr:DUF4177 domain-containing protein [Candidatus Methanovirga procula]
MREYKILTQEPKKGFTKEFDHEKMEQSINEYSKQGYKLISFEVYSLGGLGPNRFLAIFEKE